MFERILVPLDGSKTAEFVIPYVAEIASRFDSHVIVTRVSDPDVSIYASKPYLETVAENMRLQIKNFRARNKCEVELKVLMGNPANEILNCAVETECKLIVMASRGETNYSPWPLGNVAAKILRAASSPVLLIRKQADDEALKEKRLIKKILLPLDGSRLSEAAIPAATELSRKTGAAVILFRAIEPDVVVTTPGVAMTRGMAVEHGRTVITSQAKPLALKYLNGMKEAMVKDGAKVSTAIGKGPAADQIIDYAEANSVDFITMSTHGLSGIGRWVFGSVTDKVLHAGDTPVLVIRPGKTER